MTHSFFNARLTANYRHDLFSIEQNQSMTPRNVRLNLFFSPQVNDLSSKRKKSLIKDEFKFLPFVFSEEKC